MYSRVAPPFLMVGGPIPIPGDSIIRADNTDSLRYFAGPNAYPKFDCALRFPRPFTGFPF